MTGTAVVFAPAPVLTVTVEERAGDPDVHLHAGGQGVWQARMLTGLGGRAVLCGGFGGESGQVVRALLEQEGIEVAAVGGEIRNGVVVQDRREGGRRMVAEATATGPSRHDLDELHNLVLARGMEAGIAVLSGPAPPDRHLVPPDLYRRLAADLTAGGCRVIADLADEWLSAVVEGGAYLLKVSHEELRAGHLAPAGTVPELVAVMHTLHAGGTEAVLVTRAEQPALALVDGCLHEIVTPRMAPADPRGAGDSMTAGIIAGLLRGDHLPDALRLGAGAGALNATRHGLGTGSRQAVERLAAATELRLLDDQGSHHLRMNRRELAAWMTRM
ncbi:1-phosphofructokinase family hexose kinase [Kitasatospora sp. HPMI-4]|uniref:1-phosphofructokinase family hexose kinase n=1 Tax=Kitasatospora sp. HPMI-4 TaxID=3448443 RepID=UPI003F1DA7F3